MTNGQYHARLNNRTDEQREHLNAPRGLCTWPSTASLRRPWRSRTPEGCRGDLVVDGTLYLVARLADGTIGVADDKMHAAPYRVRTTCATASLRPATARAPPARSPMRG